MKRIHCIIASLFTLVCISSCEITPGSYITNERTAAGLFAFEKVENKLIYTIGSMCEMLMFDAYLQADSIEQAYILKYLLRGYKFYEKEDTLCFRSNSTAWHIVRASTDSLSSPHAVWRLGRKYKSGSGDYLQSLPFGGLIITGNKQRNAWIMEVAGSGSFEIKKLTDHKLQFHEIVNEYTIVTLPSTVAHIEERNPFRPVVSPEYFRIDYHVTKPFILKPILNGSHPLFVEGAAALDVEQGVPPVQKDHVSGEIDKSNYDFVTIHFRGMTERLPRVTYGYGSGNGVDNVYGKD